jgi:hypothetical protein
LIVTSPMPIPAAMARLACKLLILLSVLLMPLGMAAAPATARTVPVAGDHASMPMEHCPDSAPKQHMKGGFALCAMSCSAALPGFDAGLTEAVRFACEPASPVALHRLHGLHPETATPPPKHS